MSRADAGPSVCAAVVGAGACTGSRGRLPRPFVQPPPAAFPAQSSRVTLRSGEPLDPARVVREILETVQHYMGHEYVRAWPGDQVLPSLKRDPAETLDEAHIAALTAWFGAFPKPNAQVEGDTIRVWFGDESAPTLTLPSLSMR